MKSFIFILILYSTITYINAIVQQGGPCPDLKSADITFKLSDFMGQWFEILQTRRVDGNNKQCIFYNFEKASSSSFKFNAYARSGQSIRCCKFPKVLSSDGTGELIENTDGTVDIRINEMNRVNIVKILDTDYVSYAVLWSCVAFDNYRYESSVVLTREQTPSLQTLQTAYDVLGNKNIPLAFLLTVNQRNCPKTTIVTTPTNTNGTTYTTTGKNNDTFITSIASVGIPTAKPANGSIVGSLNVTSQSIIVNTSTTTTISGSSESAASTVSSTANPGSGSSSTTNDTVIIIPTVIYANVSMPSTTSNNVITTTPNNNLVEKTGTPATGSSTMNSSTVSSIITVTPVAGGITSSGTTAAGVTTLPTGTSGNKTTPVSIITVTPVAGGVSSGTTAAGITTLPTGTSENKTTPVSTIITFWPVNTINTTKMPPSIENILNSTHSSTMATLWPSISNLNNSIVNITNSLVNGTITGSKAFLNGTLPNVNASSIIPKIINGTIKSNAIKKSPEAIILIALFISSILTL